MRRLTFIIIALLACVSNSFAEDKLQVEDVLVAPGKTANLNIVLSNPDAQYTAIQVDLYLPEGIDLETDGDNYSYSLSRVAESHSLSIGKMTGFYRLILSSAKNEVLSGTSGKVISLKLKADVDLAEGTKAGTLKMIKLARKDGAGIVKEELSFNVVLSEAAIVNESIKITSAEQVPYYSEYNLDFTDKPDLKAYVATGYDKTTGTIWLTRVKQVPANTGFLLVGAAGEYDIPVAESAADCYYKNMFTGTIEGTTIQTTDGKYTNYYLSNGDKGVGFYKVTKEGGVALGPNRAYLPILTDIPTQGSAGDTEAIKVGGALQVPYYTSKNIDFTTMESQGVKAYTATGYNYSTGTIWLTRVKQVPAHTGVLVMANEAGNYEVPTASVSSIYENMFVGSETAQTIYTNETIDGVNYVNYYLSDGTEGVGFYKVTKDDGVKMGANRCYLPIPKRASSGARGESGEAAPIWNEMIINDDIIAIPLFSDGTTGIDNNNREPITNNLWYNLQGQRVENPGKGVYINNGKKVLIK